MSYWIQVFDDKICFCSTVTNVRQVDLGCPLDFEKCTQEDLEEWAREQAEKHGGCEVYDKHGTQILSDDDPDREALEDPAYKWAGYL